MDVDGKDVKQPAANAGGSAASSPAPAAASASAATAAGADAAGAGKGSADAMNSPFGGSGSYGPFGGAAGPTAAAAPMEDDAAAGDAGSWPFAASSAAGAGEWAATAAAAAAAPALRPPAMTASAATRRAGDDTQQCQLLLLPDDFLNSVFYFVEPRDIARLTATCRAMRALAESEQHWSYYSQLHYLSAYQYVAKRQHPQLQVARKFYAHRTRTAKRWADGTGVCRQLKGHREGVFQVHFVNGYEQLLSASGDGTIKLWDLNTATGGSGSGSSASASSASECVVSLQHNAGLLGMGYDAVYNRVAAGCWGGEMRVWQLNHSRISDLSSFSVRELKEALARKHVNIGALGITEKQDLIAAVKQYNAVSLTEHIATVQAHRGTIVSVDCRQGMLCSCSHDGTVKLWSVTGPAGVRPNANAAGANSGDAHNGGIRSGGAAAAAAAAGAAAGAGANGAAGAGSGKAVTLQRTYAGHNGGTDAVCFEPAHHLIASGGKDADVKLWNVETGDVEARFNSIHSNWVWCVQIDAVSGQLLCTGGVDGVVNTIDIRTPRTVNQSRIHTEISGLHAAHDAHRLVTASFDGVVRFWDTRAWRVYKELRTKTRDRCSRLNVSDDRLAVAYMDSASVRVWNFEPDLH